MSLTLDANVLLYASDEDSPFHRRAVEVIDECATGEALVYVFWPVLVGYVRLSTHPSVFARPLAPEQAIANLDDLLARPHVSAPGEDAGFWRAFQEVLAEGSARGNLVTDAHIVALMHEYNVRTILTRDRDFRRFDGIRVRDPFAAD